MISISTYTKEEILQKICQHFNIDPDKFLLPTQGKEDTLFIRQMYTYCLWLYTDLYQKEISVIINRERSCVTHTAIYIRNRCKVDPDFRNKIIEIENLFE